MAESTQDIRGGDPTRPRFLGLWVAGILLVVLFGAAGGVIADVFYREYESIFRFIGLLPPAVG